MMNQENINNSTFLLNSVVLIDDSRIDNIIHEKLLQNYSFCENLQIFRKAKKALAFLESLAFGDKSEIPELILLDIKMPGMDGFEFLEAFALLPPVLQENSKVIILSSYDWKQLELQRLRCNNPNVIFSIDKPLIPKDLLEIRKAVMDHIKYGIATSA